MIGETTVNKNILEILSSLEGDERDKLYETIAKSVKEDKKKAPVDFETLGTRENPISASLVPKLLSCHKRAIFDLETPIDLSENKKVAAGSLSDDYIYLMLKGVKDEVIKKLMTVSYPILSERETETIYKKSEVVLKYLRSGVWGEVCYELLQKDMKGKIGELWFSCHPDFVGKVGDDYKYFDFKYSGNAASTNCITYYGQLSTVAAILTVNGYKCDTVGIISTKHAEIRSSEQTESDLYATVTANESFLAVIRNVVHKLRDSEYRKSPQLFVSSDCAFCRKCFEVEGVNENEVRLKGDVSETVKRSKDSVEDKTQSKEPAKRKDAISSVKKEQKEEPKKEKVGFWESVNGIDLPDITWKS